MNSVHHFETFDEFWPFYLSQHQNPNCQLLHFWGTLFALGLTVFSLLFNFKLGLLLALIVGYGFAWAGHFVFEKNKPATFRYPFFSLRADLKMFLIKLREIRKKF